MSIKEKRLSDQEATDAAIKLGITGFSLNPQRLQRISINAVYCPVCYSRNIDIEPTKISNQRSIDNTVHRQECGDCGIVITLWNLSIGDNYII